jgi:hypothetical protein
MKGDENNMKRCRESFKILQAGNCKGEKLLQIIEGDI